MSVARPRARRRATVAGTALAAVVLSLASATGAAAEPPTPPTDDDPLPVTACGTVLTAPGDYVLMNDLTCGPVRGVAINGDDISFSLGGRTISSAESVAVGTDGVSYGHVTISGPGTVTGGTDHGVGLFWAHDSTVTGVTAAGNRVGFFQGFAATDGSTAHDNTWKNNVAIDNADYGLVVHAGDGDVISDNEFSRDGYAGVLLNSLDAEVDITRLTVQRNVVRSSVYGILAYGVSRSRVEDNTSTGNGTDLQDWDCLRGNLWLRNTFDRAYSTPGSCIPSRPAVTAIDKTAGPLAGGDEITITGQLFTGATRVSIGGVRATRFTVDSDSRITAITPPHAAGSARVVVTAPEGRTPASPVVYTYRAVPTVTGSSSASGPLAGGKRVSITGTGFTGATAVRFGTVAGSIVKVSSDKAMIVTVPAGESAGTVAVTVTAPGGTSGAARTAKYTYVAVKPAITAISATSGSTEGGQDLTLTGSGFLGATKVYVNGPATPASFTVVSDTEITLTTPSRSSGGTVRFYVAGPGGTSNGRTYKYVVPATTG